MRYFKSLFVLVYVSIVNLSGINNVYAQTYPIKFKHISYQQGLSQSPISCLFQDKKGFIWIGNREGVLRYDGYEFKIYSHSNNNPKSISHNTIRAIAQDQQDKLWVGTSNGLNIYNPIDDTFKYLDVTKKKTVTGLFIKNNNVWVASYDGLKCLDIDGKIIPLGKGIGKKIQNGLAKCLKYDSKGRLWIGFANGVSCIDPKLKKEIQLPTAIRNNHILMGAVLSSIAEDKDGDLWFATEEKGLFWYNKKADVVYNFRHANNANSILSDVIKDMLVYDAENIWLGTRLGLSIFNKRKQVFTNYTHDGSNLSSLSNNSVWCFLRDRTGNIWLGTYAGGINLYNPSLNNFENIGEKIGDGIGLSQPVVNSMWEDKNGALWVGTDGGGLNYVDRVNRKSKFYRLTDDKDPKVNPIVKVVTKTPQGKMYLGTLQGLATFNGTDGSMQYLPLNENVPLERRRVNAIVADGGDIWVAMHYIGLYQLKEDNSILTYKYNPNDKFGLSTNNVRSLLKDGDNKGIWIGTGDGLNYLDKTNGRIIRYDAFKNKTIISMLIDTKGNFWVGTDNGLVLFNPKTKEKYTIYEKNGLLSGMIEAIAEDNLGKIWVSTPKGLSSVHIRASKGRANVQGLSISNYTSNHGLSSNQFLPGAVLKTKNGELLFGGVNGITAFYPEKIIKNNYRPNVVLTDFYIHNQQTTNNTSNSPLNLPIDDVQKITLTHNNNSISFKVAALNFLNTENNQYAYRLEGLDKDEEWHYAGSQRLINYTELQPGNYIFKVKASNNDKIWNEIPRSVHIKILPPFWKTWWAYLFYFILFAGLLYLFRYYSIKAEKLKHQLELESVMHIKEQELTKRKMSFFTNISHEIKTPITMILAPLEELMEANLSKEKTRSHLKLMYQSGERLKKLIGQLLDFRKFEAGSNALLTTHNDIVSFVKEILLAFKGIADNKGIVLDLKTQSPEIWFWFDEDKMEKILFNIISNAVKFTPAQTGKISLSIDKIVFKEKEGIIISVEDNGFGISPDHIDHIFEEFKFYNDNDLNKEGTGIGLAYTRSLVQMHNGEITVESRQVTSSEEGYTKFSIKLPVLGKNVDESNLDKVGKHDELLEHYTVEGDIKKTYEHKRTEVLVGLDKEKPMLLVVEDNPDLRNFIVQSFEKEFEVIAAPNGAIGLEKSIELMPDIIVSDVMMPEMDGISLCDRLKSDIRTSHIPVILLTARSATMFKLEGFDTGADDYITKPFSVTVLISRAWNLLYSRQQLRNKFQKQIKLEPENTIVSTADAKLLTTLMNYIEKNIDNMDLTIEDLCKEALIGRGTLYKKIKALTSQTVNDFIRTVRLKRAAQLLQSKQHNVNEIAYMVGFADVNYFRKCFKEQFGITPKEYGKSAEE